MEPIVFNSLKHHLPTIIRTVSDYSQQGEAAISTLTTDLVYSRGIVDVYHGKLGEEEIIKEVFQFLEEQALLDYNAYKMAAPETSS